MRRTIQGIPFIIHSPSFYEVNARDDGSDIDRAALVFDGQWWTLHVYMKRGYEYTRDFQSLGQAVELLSARHMA